MIILGVKTDLQFPKIKNSNLSYATERDIVNSKKQKDAQQDIIDMIWRRKLFIEISE